MAAGSGVEIRVLGAADAEAFWKLRLQGLESDPQAFGESAVEHRASSIETFAARLGATSVENFVMGAFVNGELVATAGFFRNPTLKRKHKGKVWGMYVADAVRGQGIGRGLLEALLGCARTIADLEEVQLSVSASQAAARQLYRAMGFEMYAREHRALRVGEEYFDEEYMALKIRPPSKKPD